MHRRVCYPQRERKKSRTLNNTLNIETLKNSFWFSLSGICATALHIRPARDASSYSLNSRALTHTQIPLFYSVCFVCVSVHERESVLFFRRFWSEGAFFNTLYTLCWIVAAEGRRRKREDGAVVEFQSDEERVARRATKYYSAKDDGNDDIPDAVVVVVVEY